MIGGMASEHPAASIIVPTFREQANITQLTQRVFAALALADIEAEMIIVDDDSQDGTEETVEALSATYPVRVMVRKHKRGLSSAVLEGFREARYDRLLVMDADLQHPPEAIPKLLAILEQGDCDFAMGSRYGEGGRIDGSWPFHRRLASGVATLLARPLAPLSDPMSGFFAVHRRTWEEAATLNPVGYKIALELFVKGRCTSPAEVPISFGIRAEGASKFGISQQIAFLLHLVSLYWFRFRPVLVLGLILWAIILAWLGWSFEYVGR